MEEGGFDPGEMEMNEIPQDDDDEQYGPTDDSIDEDYDGDITQNNPRFSLPEGSQQETSLTKPKTILENQLIESYRDSFKSKYKIDDETFDIVRMNLEFRGG